MVIKKIITLFAVLFLLFGCDSKTEKTGQNSVSKATNEEVIESKKTETKTVDKNRKEITFTIETIEGKTFNIKEIDNGLEFKELKDKPIFLIFFGHRCPPCIREIPRLIDFNKKHEDLAIVAIEVQGLDNDSLREFSQDSNINYNLVSGDDSMDFIGYIQAKAQWSGGIPFILGIDKSGKVKFIKVGGLFDSDLERGYQELI